MSSEMFEASESSQQLLECLLSSGVVEDGVEKLHREMVLDTLGQLLRRWIRSVALAKGLPAIVADTGAGRLYTYGDHALGVYQRHDAVDAICVAPRHVDRVDFFKSFHELLRGHPLVRDLRADEAVRVPALQMSFYGVKIRLVFARLLLNAIPLSLELYDDRLLVHLDERCVRSLNGCRITKEILDLVPDIDSFASVLQVIKLWAKRRGIYSGKLGFLSGESCAVLVAYVCQLNPTALPATLVYKFFELFDQWQWPQPVMLQQTNYVDLGYSAWDPLEYLGDLMPIITPTYPQRNSASDVSASTRAVLLEEIRIGLETVEGVMADICHWGRLFQHDDYFTRYQHHMLVEARAASSKELLPWSELVENNIRHFIELLERHQHVRMAHINPNSFNCVPLNTVDVHGHPVHRTRGAFDPHRSMWFIGLVLERSSSAVELTDAISSFTGAVQCQAASTGLLREGMTLEVRQVSRRQLVCQYLSPSSLGRQRASVLSERRPHTVPAPSAAKHWRPTFATPPTQGRHSSPSEVVREDKSAPSLATTLNKDRHSYERWRNSYGLFNLGWQRCAR